MMFTNDMVRNVPEYAYNAKNPYWVARFVDGDWWFWGAYADPNKATSVAMEIDGSVNF